MRAKIAAALALLVVLLTPTLPAEAGERGRPRALAPRRDLRRALQRQGQEGPLLCVVGSAAKNSPARLDDKLHRLGAALAANGFVAAVNASLTEGEQRSIARPVLKGVKAGQGATVGYSNWRTMEQHRLDGLERDVDLLQLTRRPRCRRGLERPNTAGRAVEMIERADGVVIAGGGAEALLQFSVAYQLGLPVGVLQGSGGITERIPRLLKAFAAGGKKSEAPIVIHRDPRVLASKLARQMRQRGAAGPLSEGGDAWLDDGQIDAILGDARGRLKMVGPGENPLDFLPAPEPGQRRIVVGVYGGADPLTAKVAKVKNDAVGKAIASLEGWQGVGLTGACPGNPNDVAEAILDHGGLAVGISAYRTARRHVRAGRAMKLSVLQFTHGPTEPNLMPREIDNITFSDVALISGGRNGTLGEVALALLEGRPVGVLEGTGGITTEIRGVLDALAAAGEDYRAKVFFDGNAPTLVRQLVRAHEQDQR
jgi:predicted Rossmann-fold nucleotide-binding protein